MFSYFESCSYLQNWKNIWWYSPPKKGLFFLGGVYGLKGKAFGVYLGPLGILFDYLTCKKPFLKTLKRFCVQRLFSLISKVLTLILSMRTNTLWWEKTKTIATYTRSVMIKEFTIKVWSDVKRFFIQVSNLFFMRIYTSVVLCPRPPK